MILFTSALNGIVGFEQNVHEEPSQHMDKCYSGSLWISDPAFPTQIQGVPPGHQDLNIGRIKLHSSMTFI
jgi:hypothetical protein